ncbi:tRNA-dihydrouridine synthase [Candidatus Daviesbacteria bacterium]|nr:tRNA-dihydrouridine synthase [Candidatus Daviesbacteria bacterium]
MLHLVDLNGAKDGQLRNLPQIRKIRKEVSIPIEVGGGVRSFDSVKLLINLGIDQVVLGTMALENLDALKKIAKNFAGKISIALDAKNGKLMKKGWLEETKSDAVEIAKKLEGFGINRFIYTDILKDGTLTEPNYQAIKKLKDSINGKVVASGGISIIEQVKKLKSIGISEVILGKALYEGQISIEEALAC